MATIVAGPENYTVSGDYGRRKWRQIVSLRVTKTVRFDSKWKTTIRTALYVRQAAYHKGELLEIVGTGLYKLYVLAVAVVIDISV